MEIQTRYYNKIVIILVAGRFYTNNTQTFLQAVTEHLAAGYKCLVIDLSQVDVLNSVGIKALVLAAREARQNGGELRIANARKYVRYVLKLAGVDELIKEYPSLVTATASYVSDLYPDKQADQLYPSCRD